MKRKHKDANESGPRPPIGAQVSTAGGFAPVPERARALGCEAVQMFSSNPRMWRTRTPTPDELHVLVTGLQEYRLPLDTFLDKVKLADGAVKKFYDDNSRQFEMPEQAKVEFVVLSMDAIAAALAISDGEVKAWYDGHKDRYQQAEERRASHILIGFEKLGKDKARAKAEEVLKEVRKNPAAFADLARKNSDDPGSAAKGGDLGFFGSGMMVKPFEDATFALKENEISGIVESDFGFHIIKLTGIHVAKGKDLAEVRGEIEAELKKAAP
jgi:peptidyl-prolyl cis-trans isomerase D